MESIGERRVQQTILGKKVLFKPREELFLIVKIWSVLPPFLEAEVKKVRGEVK
jgi:hypothetical protein